MTPTVRDITGSVVIETYDGEKYRWDGVPLRIRASPRGDGVIVDIVGEYRLKAVKDISVTTMYSVIDVYGFPHHTPVAKFTRWDIGKGQTMTWFGVSA